MSSAHQNDTHVEYDPLSAIPITVDRRPPQLNEALSLNRCGCACTTRTRDVQIDFELSADFISDNDIPTSRAIDDSEDNNYSVNGDEGAAEHMIEVGDFGPISYKVIFTALAKHNRCTCHSGVLLEADDYPFTYPSSLGASGLLLPDSMLVECNGSTGAASPGIIALSASVMSLASAAGSDTYLGMGAHLDDKYILPSTSTVSYFHTRPIPLTAERTYCSNLEAGMPSVPSDLSELNTGDGTTSIDHSRYDFW